MMRDDITEEPSIDASTQRSVSDWLMQVISGNKPAPPPAAIEAKVVPPSPMQLITGKRPAEPPVNDVAPTGTYREPEWKPEPPKAAAPVVEIRSEPKPQPAPELAPNLVTEDEISRGLVEMMEFPKSEISVDELTLGELPDPFVAETAAPEPVKSVVTPEDIFREGVVTAMELERMVEPQPAPVPPPAAAPVANPATAPASVPAAVAAPLYATTPLTAAAAAPAYAAAPVAETAVAPVSATAPVPVPAAEPAPAYVTAPVSATAPALAPATEPAPAFAAAPTPVPVPVPVYAAAPVPASAIEPAPVFASAPAPAFAAVPVPVPPGEPAPLPVAEPVSAFAAAPTTVPAPAPAFATVPAPVPVDAVPVYAPVPAQVAVPSVSSESVPREPVHHPVPEIIAPERGLVPAEVVVRRPESVPVVHAVAAEVIVPAPVGRPQWAIPENVPCGAAPGTEFEGFANGSVFAREGIWGDVPRAEPTVDAADMSPKAEHREPERRFSDLGSERLEEIAGRPEFWAGALKTLMATMAPLVARALPMADSAKQNDQNPELAHEVRHEVSGLRMAQFEVKTAVQEHSNQLKKVEEQLTRLRDSMDRDTPDGYELTETVNSAVKMVRLVGIGLGVLLLVLIVMVGIVLAHH